MSQPDPDGVQYQSVLRTLGADLDENEARSIRVIEIPSGFIVEYERDEGPVHTEISLADLAKRGVALERHRSHGPFKAHGNHGQGYQDSLRALGYQLDQMLARYIVLDEIDDSLLVTYLFVNPTQGFMYHKRMATLGPDERDVLQRDATARRRAEPPRKRGLMKILS